VAITLYYHPFSRAANGVWMLEEAGIEYQLRWVDIMSGDRTRRADPSDSWQTWVAEPPEADNRDRPLRVSSRRRGRSWRDDRVRGPVSHHM
jgi:hypothetical protein